MAGLMSPLLRPDALVLTLHRAWFSSRMSLVLVLSCTSALLPSCRLRPFWCAPSQPAGSRSQSSPQCPGPAAPASRKSFPAWACLALGGLALKTLWEMAVTGGRAWALEKGTWIQILPLVPASSEPWASRSFLSMPVSRSSNNRLL